MLVWCTGVLKSTINIAHIGYFLILKTLEFLKHFLKMKKCKTKKIDSFKRKVCCLDKILFLEIQLVFVYKNTIIIISKKKLIKKI